MNLDYILAPLTKDVFFADYWEKNILHLAQNKPSHFDPLFGVSALDEIIASHHLHYPSLKLSKNGKPLDKSQYTHQVVQRGGDNFAFEIDVEAVHHHYRDGATVRLMALEKSWQPTINLRNSLEQDLGHEVQINAYLTPPNANGLALHYDPHDVFVLQISGRKNWLVYDAPYELPLASATVVREPNRLILDTCLIPGNVLYMPRGFYHVAKTSESHSLHLTIGLKVFRVIDALKICLNEILDEKCQEIAFRKSLPPDLFKSEEARMIATEMLRNGLNEIFHDIDPSNSIAKLVSFFEQSRPTNGKLFFKSYIEGE